MTESAAYIAQETAIERKPVELYHIWTEYDNWYYVNSDMPILYGGNTYVPAVLARGSLEKDGQLNSTKLTVSFAYIQEAVVEYIAENSVDLTWISIMRVFQDQVPIEASVIFIGHIRDISFKGQQGQATCVGFEYFLNRPIPRYRYQPQCNWKLFDARCQLVRNDYTVQYWVTAVSSDGLAFTTTALPTYLKDRYPGGQVWRYYQTEPGGVYHIEKRMIVSLDDNANWGIRFKMKSLLAGDSIYISPGCDGVVTTCQWYGNIVNFGGFPYIPLDNPVAWVWS
jgi:uncharacterized phage protein (TIGR02218 family)